MLKVIGWWLERLDDRELPAPQELVGELPSEVRTKLVDYLGSGLPLIWHEGYDWCRFVCGIENSKMGSRDLTDGIWVWPEALAHYVEAHRVVLPSEFMTHAMSGRSKTKPDGAQDYRDYDAEYWTGWCAARRVPAIQEGLRGAYMAIQAQPSAAKAKCVDALERKHGLSSEKCAWSRCLNNALVGMAICAEHSFSSDPVFTSTAVHNAVLLDYLRQVS
jgi:hypothetical protein